MNKKVLIFLAIIVVIVAAWVASIDGTKGTRIVKNAETMAGIEAMPIVSQADVDYFAGAKGYFARPEAPGRYPGVVMIHENRGLRPEVRDAADALAGEGYMVLAVDLFGGTAEDQTAARALTASFKQETGTANMRAATAYLRGEGAGKIASLGWCFGGRQSVELSVSGERLDATVVYYGGGMATTTTRLAHIKWPVLGIFGDKDQVIPLSTVAAFEASLKSLGVDVDIHVYPGVGHAFANPSGANYAPEATADAWEKTLAFLARNLK